METLCCFSSIKKAKARATQVKFLASIDHSGVSSDGPV